MLYEHHVSHMMKHEINDASGFREGVHISSVLLQRGVRYEQQVRICHTHVPIHTRAHAHHTPALLE